MALTTRRFFLHHEMVGSGDSYKHRLTFHVPISVTSLRGLDETIPSLVRTTSDSSGAITRKDAINALRTLFIDSLVRQQYEATPKSDWATSTYSKSKKIPPMGTSGIIVTASSRDELSNVENAIRQHTLQSTRVHFCARKAVIVFEDQLVAWSSRTCLVW